jgi:hypothetical protein
MFQHNSSTEMESDHNRINLSPVFSAIYIITSKWIVRVSAVGEILHQVHCFVIEKQGFESRKLPTVHFATSVQTPAQVIFWQQYVEQSDNIMHI